MSWLVGYLRVDPATGIAPGIDVLAPDGIGQDVAELAAAVSGGGDPELDGADQGARVFDGELEAELVTVE